MEQKVTRQGRRAPLGAALVGGVVFISGSAVGVARFTGQHSTTPIARPSVSPQPVRAGVDVTGGAGSKIPAVKPVADTSLVVTLKQLSRVQSSLRELFALPPGKRTPKVLLAIHALEQREAGLLQRARSLMKGTGAKSAKRQLAAAIAATGKQLKATNAADAALHHVADGGRSPGLVAAARELDTQKGSLADQKDTLQRAIDLLSSPLVPVAEPPGDVPRAPEERPGHGRPHWPVRSPGRHDLPGDPPKAVDSSRSRHDDAPAKGSPTERPPILGRPPRSAAVHLVYPVGSALAAPTGQGQSSPSSQSPATSPTTMPGADSNTPNAAPRTSAPSSNNGGSSHDHSGSSDDHGSSHDHSHSSDDHNSDHEHSDHEHSNSNDHHGSSHDHSDHDHHNSDHDHHDD
ncbi:hypothetical protein [Actinoallomurus sp. NPDC050550]|uniref:hypothetical protein n=1 Tax=Actinoallomurus sp. NPDC050550 TaxID=3154937 RepID=UPI0033FDF06D